MRTVLRRQFYDASDFWVGSNHDHRLMKVEPLD